MLFEAIARYLLPKLSEHFMARREVTESVIRARLIVFVYTVAILVLVMDCYINYEMGRYALVYGSIMAALMLLFCVFYKYKTQYSEAHDLSRMPLLVGLAIILLSNSREYVEVELLWSHALVCLSFLILPLRFLVFFNFLFVSLFSGFYLTYSQQALPIVPLSRLWLLSFFGLLLVYKFEYVSNRLKALATVDEVTGAYNEYHMMKLLRQEIDRVRITKHALTFISIDIQEYRQIQDIYGHGEANRLLGAFAEAVYGLIRTGDELFRFGEDKFLLLLPNSSRDGAIVLQDRLAKAVSLRDWGVIGNIKITTGYATFRTDESAEDFVARAKATLKMSRKTMFGEVTLA